jgi:hypothetical protein
MFNLPDEFGQHGRHNSEAERINGNRHQHESDCGGLFCRHRAGSMAA